MIAAAIIAGGPARRLGGIQKPLLRVGGRSIAARQLAILRDVFPRVIVVANDPSPWADAAVDVVPDRLPSAGPLAGIHAAVAALPAAAAVVCVAGDMPFLARPVLEALRDCAPDALAVAPCRTGRAEPLCARYAVSLQQRIAERIGSGRLAVHEFLADVSPYWIADPELAALDAAGLGFFNVNSPGDLARAEEIATTRGL